MSYEDLQTFFATHVVELVAIRRHHKPGKGQIRAFFCTTSFPLLNSMPGLVALHFKAPTGRGNNWKKSAKGHNLITVWDIFMQDWRNINLNNYAIREVLRLKSATDIQFFWKYFTYVLKSMSANEKVTFMDNRGYRTFTLDGVKKYIEEMENERIIRDSQSGRFYKEKIQSF